MLSHFARYGDNRLPRCAVRQGVLPWCVYWDFGAQRGAAELLTVWYLLSTPEHGKGPARRSGKAVERRTLVCAGKSS